MYIWIRSQIHTLYIYIYSHTYIYIELECYNEEVPKYSIFCKEHGS